MHKRLQLEHQVQVVFTPEASHRIALDFFKTLALSAKCWLLIIYAIDKNDYIPLFTGKDTLNF